MGESKKNINKVLKNIIKAASKRNTVKKFKKRKNFIFSKIISSIEFDYCEWLAFYERNME